MAVRVEFSLLKHVVATASAKYKDYISIYIMHMFDIWCDYYLHFESCKTSFHPNLFCQAPKRNQKLLVIRFFFSNVIKKDAFFYAKKIRMLFKLYFVTIILESWVLFKRKG